MLVYEDNRNFYRMLINAECDITKGEQQFTGVCKDLSATGMSFAVSNGHFSLGDMLDIAIDSSNREIPSFSAQAEVIREPKVQGKNVVVGVKFHKMN